jgi:hypothetical protein
MLSPKSTQRVPSDLYVGQAAHLHDRGTQNPRVGFTWPSVSDAEGGLDGLLHS